MNKKRTWLKITIILVILGICALGIFKFIGKEKGPTYKTEEAKTTKIVEKVEASGTINPVTQTSVGTQVSGIVQEITVDYNSIVTEGQVLAVIDPSTYQSNVTQQQANLQKVESVYKNAQRNYERYKKLYKDDLVSKSDLDDAETDYLSAQAQVVQAQATLDKANIDLGYTKVVSPVNGIVISKEVEAGQTVAASFQTPTLFLVAEDLTKMQIEVNISEADIGKIKDEQDVEFTVDAYPLDTFKGKVSQVRNSPTTVQNVVTYTVIVAVDNKDLKLKPGMTANASIITASRNDALSVANQALRFVPPANAIINGQQNKKYKGQGVWTANTDKSIKRIEVQTGITDGNRTEITGGDLKEGEVIILATATAADTKKSQRMGHPGF